MSQPQSDQPAHLPLPPWLRVKTGKARLTCGTRALVNSHGLHTVCDSAHCPNIGECFSSHTATFLIMGSVCTRNCRFCAVDHGQPQPLDPGEPRRLAEASVELGLQYVVVTSVTRDDVEDGGASHFAATIQSLRDAGISQVEVLIPDFQGQIEPLKTVLQARPYVLNHNVETIRRLCPTVRPAAAYDRSLDVLRHTRELDPKIIRKSGFMVGLGETDDEVMQLIEDLQEAGCQILTIGQYLRPSRAHLPVQRYVEPEKFDAYALAARKIGIPQVLAGPFVRSSYRAAETAAALAS